MLWNIGWHCDKPTSKCSSSAIHGSRSAASRNTASASRFHNMFVVRPRWPTARPKRLSPRCDRAISNLRLGTAGLRPGFIVSNGSGACRSDSGARLSSTTWGKCRITVGLASSISSKPAARSMRTIRESAVVSVTHPAATHRGCTMRIYLVISGSVRL